MTTRCAQCCLRWAVSKLLGGVLSVTTVKNCTRCQLLQQYPVNVYNCRTYEATRMRVAVICFRRAIRFSLWHMAQVLLRLVEMLS